jgi:hypothetical protein
VFTGEIGGGHCHAPARQRKLAQAQLLERLAAVDQYVAVVLQPLEDRNLVKQRGVLDDQRVGLGDRLANADRTVADPAERNDRGAGALGAEARERLRVLAAVESGDRQQFRRRDDALPTSAVYAYLEDVLNVSRWPLPGMRGSTGWRQ